jgi:hypothetical protein
LNTIFDEIDQSEAGEILEDKNGEDKAVTQD